MTTRRGFTLPEVLVALTILGGALLASAVFAQRFALSARVAGSRSEAGALVAERLEEVRAAPRYDSLPAFAATEVGIARGLTRVTTVRRVIAPRPDTADYTLVTVQVFGAGVRDTLRNTIALARWP